MLSMLYEPWRKWVEITFRLDDTQADPYDLIRFWYSKDDGYTWSQVSPGDVWGRVKSLESGVGDSAVTHVIHWDTRGYNLKAGDLYRFRIECVPNGYTETSMLPFLKWNTPVNPYLDQAENTLADVIGRVETLRFDPDLGRWIKRQTPTMNPGQLAFLAREHENIRRFETVAAPNGVYSFDSPSGQGWPPLPSWYIPDPSGYILPAASGGYTQWLAEKYGTSETVGSALRRINEEMYRLINIVIPDAQDSVAEQEIEIRKDLIRQGYYAEQYFLAGGASGIKESVLAQVIATRDGNTMLDDLGDPLTLEREWKFRVQQYATGGENLYNAAGEYHPNETTWLERVFYKFQMDAVETFDSQPDNKVLRELLYNWNGERLAVSEFFQGIGASNPDSDTLDESREDEGRPWEDQPSDRDGMKQFSGFNPTEYPITTIGGTIKIKADDLPGQRSTDMLPDGMAQWDGNYFWRIRAYNAFDAALLARPRPKITLSQVTAGLAVVAVDYRLYGHERIDTASLRKIGSLVDGFQISRQTKSPVWENITAIDWVSDRRASTLDFATSNTIPWIPKGTDRPYPTVVFDSTRMQYVFFNTKTSFDPVRIRPVSAMSINLPTACEFDVLFDDFSATWIYRPVVIKALNTSSWSSPAGTGWS